MTFRDCDVQVVNFINENLIPICKLLFFCLIFMCQTVTEGGKGAYIVITYKAMNFDIG